MQQNNYYDQHTKMKKKDLLKINTSQHEPQQFNQIRHSIASGNKQAVDNMGHQMNSQQYSNQGVHVKNVASKGATGRKGSLPLNYQQAPALGHHQVQQSQPMYMNSQSSQHRSSQPHIAPNNNNGLEANTSQPNGKGANKSVKSHAKYFSQQNSPVGKESKAVFSNQQQPSLVANGASGIILSSSGAGIIGIDNSFHNPNVRGIMNEMNNQSSHHNTGNFGSNPSHHIVNHQATDQRQMKNYSQMSQHSNGSGMRDYKQNQYMQQLIASEQQAMNQMKQNTQHMSNQSKMASTTSHMKQIHQMGGPILSQYAGNQTIASNGNSQHSNFTQQASATFNASINKHMKPKQQYEENYLNGPLNATSTANNKSSSIGQHGVNKRTLNNQSQQLNYDDQLRQGGQLPIHHKRVVSSQNSQLGQYHHQNSLRAGGNQSISEINRNEINYNQKQNNYKHPKTAQQPMKNMGDKNHEAFQKSGNISYLNQNNIVLNATNERMVTKNKNKAKAQTRPNSNSKVKQNQLQGSFVNDSALAQHLVKDQNGMHIQQSKKSKNVIQSAQTTTQDRKTKVRYVDSQHGKRSTPQTILTFNKQQVDGNQSGHNMSQGNTNLIYYGAQKQGGNDMSANPSQVNIPMIQNSNSAHHSRDKSKQSVVTVPQTMLHKSNKLMNNYLKQSTIQQPEQQNQQIQQQNQQVFNKRLSTDQIMMERDQLSFSMKKQSFHQRAETQLKNPNTPGLHPFAQHYDGGKENETMGGSIQGPGSSSNSFLVIGQHHNSLQNMINTQNPNQGGKYHGTNGQGMKYNNTKSQKSSTSRLINSSASTSNKFVHTSKNNFTIGNQVQNSADRIPISQRSDHIIGMDANHHHIQSVNINDLNYGAQKLNMVQGVMTSNSSKQLAKHQAKNNKLNTLTNPQYPYQSSSTKSNKNLTTQQKQNLSIAQIFQQKGLNYKGPSKVSVNSQTNNAQAKIAQRMGVNGVIVHTKGGIGIKGSLTTSANTAQNSPRAMVSKQGMYVKNQMQSSNLGSIRKKPSTASIAGASIGPHSQVSMGQKNSNSSKFNPNMQNTSNGNTFKKVTGQSKSGIQSRDDSPLLYQDENDVNEINQFEGADKINHLEPTKLKYKRGSMENYNVIAQNEEVDNKNMHQNGQPKRSIVAYKNQVKSQFVNSQGGVKKQLIIGTQASSQYIADNGGTGSNPAQQHHQKAMSQHEFYSQNVDKQGHMKLNPSQGQIGNNSGQAIPQKKNQHSNSLGNMQQFDQMKQKHAQQPISGPHPTPKIEKPGKGEGTYGKYQMREDDELHRDNLIDDEFEVQGPLITEEEEQEIRQVASDINEKAFYGKILRAKQVIQDPSNGDEHYRKLSPRSQEIATVMKQIHTSFSLDGTAPETDINYYRVGKMLGRGAFGKVNLAMHKLVRKLVALKSLNKECLTDEVQKHKLMKEVNLLLKMRHDHVVKIYETIETKKHIIIVMELCAGGDLLNYVRKRRRLKEPHAKKIFRQIIEGLQYIHSKYVAHRDIKLDNILLDGKGSVKIADFGVSKQCQPGVKMREQCGTPAYIAPEILKNKNGYGFGVDLWSAGVVLFAMLYGTVPFKAASMDELHGLILRGVYTLKEDISQEARDMLRGLLEINPHKRLTIPEILTHPWLKDYDETLQLFNDQEREMIKKEYTYNDPSRYNRNENEEPVDCFTEHNIDSVYNTMKNASEKSIILAPFNSTQSEDFESFKKNIQPMMFEKNLVIRLSRLCREIDRQYEFNNNGQLDNGVYHKQINATNESDGSADSKGEKGKKKKKPVSDDEDDESRFQIIQCTKSMGQEFNTEDYGELKIDQRDKHGRLMSRMQQLNLLNPSTMGTKEMVIDHNGVQKLTQFGYPYDYISECLQENMPNYCSAGYYLLQMDQNYC